MTKLRSYFFKSTGALLVLSLTSGCGDSNDVVGVGGSGTGSAGTAGTGAGGAGTAGTGAGGLAGNGGSAMAGATNGGSAGGGGAAAVTTPTVNANIPLDDAIDIALNSSARVTFSEAMDAGTLSTTTFTLTSGAPPVAVTGRVVASGSKAAFWSTAPLASQTEYTATITTGVESAAGVPLDADHTWSFTTGDTLDLEPPVDLGTAGDYAILAKTGVDTVPPSAVTGDIGCSPAAATYITGFTLTADATTRFSRSAQVTGEVYAANYASPTPSNLTTAIGDMEYAFTDAAGRAPDVTELGDGNIGGMTLEAGTYKWGTGLLIPTDATLDGSATDIWIFQIAQDLTLANGVELALTGGALPQNVFWQVSGAVEIGTTAHLEGVVLSQTAITLATGASINGRLLAQTAVNIQSSTVVEPDE